MFVLKFILGTDIIEVKELIQRLFELVLFFMDMQESKDSIRIFLFRMLLLHYYVFIKFEPYIHII